MFKQALAKLAQHSGVETRIVWLKMQRVLPVKAEAQLVGGFAVGQVFERLEDRHERQQHWRDARLAVAGLQIGKVFVAELVEQHLTDELVDRVLGEQVFRKRDRGIGNGMRCNRFEAHR